MSINIQTENNELKKIAGTYGIDIESNITTDSELSLESSNPIQNQAVAQGLNTIEDTVGAIRLTKKYINEHNTLSSFINGLKENTCYVFVLTHSTLSEALTLVNIGFLHQQRENGILKISCGFNKYGIFVEFSDGINDIQQRSIVYNPNYTDNYQLNDWHTLITKNGSVQYADTAGNADTVDGYHVYDPSSENPYGKIPLIKPSGVMEVGKYIDFHNPDNTDADFDCRLMVDTGGNLMTESDFYAKRLVAEGSYPGYGYSQFEVRNSSYPLAKVLAYVDQEGGNLRLSTNEENNYYELDTLGNSLRLYHYYKGKTPSLLFSSGSGEKLELNINGTAAKATCDYNGNNIANTYVKIGGITTTLEVTSGIKVTGAKGIHAGNNSLYLTNHSGQSSDDNAAGIQISSNNILPYVKGYYEEYKIYLGTSSKPFGGVYSTTSLHVISDKRKKDNINELNAQTTEKLIEKIKSVSYTLIDGESGRTHYGMISQQVEEVLNELGIDSKDFAAFIKSPVTEDIMEQATNNEGELLFDEDDNPVMIKVGENETGDFTYMLRYEEFIPILWKNAQDKNRKIEQLQNSNEELNNKVVSLEGRIVKLEEYINNTI